jgi:signal-transduction protein with cAMP-binding, CBS, and nucleotidyltransferase domain
VPLVNLVRFHAIAAGVTISPTLDRLEAIAGLGALDTALTNALREAFEVIARAELRGALRAIRRAQRQVEVFTGARP